MGNTPIHDSLYIRMILKSSVHMAHALRNVSSWRIVFLTSILIVGLLSSYLVGESVREEARKRWVERARYDVTQLTDTFFTAIDESQAFMYSMAVLFQGDIRVTPEAFQQSADFLKTNTHIYAPEAMVVSLPRGEQDWIIEMATRNQLGLEPGFNLGRIPEAKDNLVSTFKRGDRMIFGASAELLPGVYFGFSSVPIELPDGIAVLTAVFDINEIDTDIGESTPYGLGLAISSRHADGVTTEGRDHLYPEGKDSSDALKLFNIEKSTGEASLYFHWGVIDSYLGGPHTGLANLILIGGATITLFITVFVAFILAQNTRIQRRVEEQTKYLKLMERIAVASNEATAIEDAVQICLDEVCALTGWPIGHVYRRSDEGNDKYISGKIWHLDKPEMFKAFQDVTERIQFSPGSGLPGRVAQSGEPAWITDISKDPDFPRAQQAVDIGVKAAFAFPIKVGNEVPAVLEFFTTEVVEPDEPLLDLMARPLGHSLVVLLNVCGPRKRSDIWLAMMS